MSIEKFGDWGRAADILKRANANVQQAVRRAVLQEAHYARAKIVEGFREQAPGGKRWAPLSPFTLAARVARGFRGTKALIDRGDLRNSITVLERPEGAFVGVLRQATGADGKSLYNVAVIHEQGAGPIIIPVSPQMRRYLHWKFRAGGMSDPPTYGNPVEVIVVIIPPRPFIGPVFDRYFQPEAMVAERFMARFAHLAGGDFGLLGPPPPTR